MNISPNEAEEALAAIQRMAQKTRQSVASSGAYIFLIITGTIWLVGFLSNQFLAGAVVAYIWIGVSLLGSLLSVLLGARMRRRVRSTSTASYARRIGITWLLLIFYCIATIAIARPADGKQITMFIILFIMIGQLAMGLLFSFSATWWALPITALALAGYFLLPGIFYLWMAILVGGGMIALGLYIRIRW
jgi:hypothetical protein